MQTPSKPIVPIHVFIDTNVFLSFFAFTKDDLQQLKKLIAAIDNENLIVYLPDQVIDEFDRNREKKISEALSQFKSVGPQALPRMLADFNEANDYQKAVAALEKAKNALVKHAEKLADASQLGADQLFAALIDKAKRIALDDAILKKARDRHDRGNPPGKPGSYGDQINWECLLYAVPKSTDLHIVARDGDFESPLRRAHIHGFLASEWQEKKGANVTLHNEIGPFLKAAFDIELKATSEAQEKAVENLCSSGSFASTHAHISTLTPYLPLLTQDQLEALADATTYNIQIAWILGDADVEEFYTEVLKKLPPKVVESKYGDLAKQLQFKPQ